MPRAASAGRSAAASRTVSSKYPHRAGHHRPAVVIQEGKAERSCGRPRAGRAGRPRSTARSGGRPRTGRTSPAACHRGGLRTPGARSGAAACATDGDQPQCARRTRSTCAAVRPGFSRFSAAASSSTSASVRGIDLPGWRDQRVEPAGPPGPDPPVDRAPRHAHRVAERPRMRAGSQLTDQPAPLPRRQRRVGCLADQLVTEQRHLLGPVGPAALLPVPDITTSSMITVKDHRSPRLADHPPAAQGQLVLITPAAQDGASSIPEVTAAASCQRVTSPTAQEPRRRRRGRSDRGHRITHREPGRRPAAADQSPGRPPAP